MEGVRSKPETGHCDLGRVMDMCVDMPRPKLSDPLEKLHSQTYSFLTAARLVRRGWTEDEKEKGWKFSYSDSSARSISKLRGNQDPSPAENCLKDPRSRRVFVVTCSKTTEDRQTGSVNTTDGSKQTAEGAFSVPTEAESQTGLCQPDVVRVWTSGCRSTCRRFRRFKAPLLPIIAEM